MRAPTGPRFTSSESTYRLHDLNVLHLACTFPAESASRSPSIVVIYEIVVRHLIAAGGQLVLEIVDAFAERALLHAVALAIDDDVRRDVRSPCWCAA